MNDLLNGSSPYCSGCASRKKAAATPKATRVARAKHASLFAKQWAEERAKVRAETLGVSVADYESIRNVMASAKQRCTNPNDAAFPNYGGRGIEFRFASTKEATLWVIGHLGARPTPEHSIDRIDNGGHYEPNNLRWATRKEQNSNKRQYRRSTDGERIRALQLLRPDLTYETIRMWIKLGGTDEELIKRRKYARTGV